MCSQRHIASARPCTATLTGFPNTLVALPRAAPDVVIALHQLPDKLQTTSLGLDRWDGLCLPFLHKPECALSSCDLLQKNQGETKKEGFRPHLMSDAPSGRPEPTRLHTTLLPPLGSVARAFEKSVVVVTALAKASPKIPA